MSQINKDISQSLVKFLKSAKLRPTRQRLALAQLLFGDSLQDDDTPHRHITAEHLHEEARSAGITVSLATVYNTLNQFTRAGLLREISLHSGSSYFDTNTNPHHHFYCERAGVLVDIPAHELPLSNLPKPPDEYRIASVDIIIRLERDKQ